MSSRVGSYEGLDQAILDRVRQRRSCRDCPFPGLGCCRELGSALEVLLSTVLRPGVRAKDTYIGGIFGEEGRHRRFVSKSCVRVDVDGVSHVLVQVAVSDGFFVFGDGVEGGYRVVHLGMRHMLLTFQVVYGF